MGAYGGRKEIMDMIAPSGPVYQAGTLSGNPLAVSAGIETLKRLKPGGLQEAGRRSAALADGIGKAAKKAGVPLTQTRVGSMMGAFFMPGPVVDWGYGQEIRYEGLWEVLSPDAGAGHYLAPHSSKPLSCPSLIQPATSNAPSKPPHSAFKNL